GGRPGASRHPGRRRRPSASPGEGANSPDRGGAGEGEAVRRLERARPPAGVGAGGGVLAGAAPGRTVRVLTGRIGAPVGTGPTAEERRGAGALREAVPGGH